MEPIEIGCRGTLGFFASLVFAALALVSPLRAEPKAAKQSPEQMALQAICEADPNYRWFVSCKCAAEELWPRFSSELRAEKYSTALAVFQRCCTQGSWEKKGISCVGQDSFVILESLRLLGLDIPVSFPRDISAFPPCEVATKFGSVDRDTFFPTPQAWEVWPRMWTQVACRNEEGIRAKAARDCAQAKANTNPQAAVIDCECYIEKYTRSMMTIPESFGMDEGNAQARAMADCIHML